MITVNQKPVPLTPTNVPHIYTLTSSDISPTNYKYIMDVYIDVNDTGQTPSRIARIKASPNSSGVATFDLQNIVFNAIKPNIKSEQNSQGSVSPYNNIPFNDAIGFSNGYNTNSFYDKERHITYYRVLVGEQFTSGGTEVTNISSSPNIPCSIFTYQLDEESEFPTIYWYNAGSEVYGNYAPGYNTYYRDDFGALITSGTSANADGSYGGGASRDYTFTIEEIFSGIQFVFTWTDNGWSHTSTIIPEGFDTESPCACLTWPGAADKSGSYIYSGYIGDPSLTTKPSFYGGTTPNNAHQFFEVWKYQMSSGVPTENLPKLFLNSGSNPVYNISQTGITTSRVRRRYHHPDCPIIVSFFNGILSREPGLEFENKVNKIAVQTFSSGSYSAPTTTTFRASVPIFKDPTPNQNITYFTYTGLTNTSKVGFWLTNDAATVNYNTSTFSEFLEFINKGKDCLSDPIHLAFLNRQGVWDTYTLDRKATETRTLTKNTYEQGGIRNLPLYSQLSSQAQKVVYHTDLITSMRVSTWFIEQDEYPVIQDIFTSSQIYIIQRDKEGLYDYLLPVYLNTNTIEEYKNRYGKIYQYTFQLEYTPINEYMTQG